MSISDRAANPGPIVCSKDKGATVRNVIISFAIVTMTGMFTAMLGAQAGIVVNAARGPSYAPLADVPTPIGANVGANHAALGAGHPAT
jgi:hypothetical protein